VTAYFIVLYWRETQNMKLQMIEQNCIANKQLKGSMMPILDIRFEKGQPPPEFVGGQIQFSYDVFVHNKGKGPAFNINIQRFVSETRGQKEVVRNPPISPLEHFQKTLNMIGVGESIKVHTERSDSYRSFTIMIRFSDVFKDNYEWIYEGDRDGVSIKSFNLFKNN